MTNQITTFSNDLLGDVRTTTDEHGNPILCLSDVCKILEISNPSQAKTRLNQDGCHLIELNTLSNNEGVKINTLGNSDATFINEPNLYRLIFQSRKKQAKQFQDWVFETVLPSIRRNGGYIVGQKSISREDFNKAVLQEAQILAGTVQRTLSFYKSMCAELQSQVDRLQAAL